MARITIVDDEATLTDPVLVEGFPGVGLVGKIAVDHLIEVHGMTHYANVHCEGLPRVATYSESDTTLRTPVRLYADPDADLLALQSDVPVNPGAATEFAGCLAGWFDDEAVFPVYLSGIGRQRDDASPELYGVAAGDGASRLADASVADPIESGLISGPTGAMLADAIERGSSAVGLVVESDPQFPDPEAARTLIDDGIDPIAGTTTPTDALVDQATEIREAKQEFARRMQQAESESSQAEPLKMYQ
ncbi:proteasome assembly chaperone family protein [Halorubrum sp. JWXQ-INN 858]|uniref:proteasome assembly chaperone family protein n=1 Tax=Halorubrum sp. JWXQ-INN 858 TaxID=2690782 RepID=UPI00135A10BC|nr:PAC2 family protein [Halorubrum sp. JWXQ-INN 858]MWV64526.1 proteasome assembly chaperone family protein [Halorubrum sp. JWXQ-INN 858]